MLRRLDTASERQRCSSLATSYVSSRPSLTWPSRVSSGVEMAAMTPMMTTTIMSSVNVKPAAGRARRAGRTRRGAHDAGADGRPRGRVELMGFGSAIGGSGAKVERRDDLAGTRSDTGGTDTKEAHAKPARNAVATPTQR